MTAPKLKSLSVMSVDYYRQRLIIKDNKIEKKTPWVILKSSYVIDKTDLNFYPKVNREVVVKVIFAQQQPVC